MGIYLLRDVDELFWEVYFSTYFRYLSIVRALPFLDRLTGVEDRGREIERENTLNMHVDSGVQREERLCATAVTLQTNYTPILKPPGIKS